MLSNDFRGGNPFARHAMPQIRPLILCLTTLVISHATAWAQATDANKAPNTPAVAATTPLPAPTLGNVSFTPRWSALSSAQQQALQPLASTWDSLSDGHKRKWIALAKNYSALTPIEKETLHSRMAEWASLTPRDRELARFNFVQTKKLPVPDRASNWEAYKALSPEERQKLAEQARVKSAGAAAVIKPVPPEKLTSIPFTRHSPQGIRELENLKQRIDRRTLLPLPPRPTPVPATDTPAN